MITLNVQLPNGKVIQVDVPPEVVYGGGEPPKPPIPPKPPGGDDFLGVPEVPDDGGKGGLNIRVVKAINMFLMRYRHHHRIPEWTVLTHAQIAEIVGDIENVIYKAEGINKPKR